MEGARGGDGYVCVDGFGHNHRLHLGGGTQRTQVNDFSFHFGCIQLEKPKCIDGVDGKSFDFLCILYADVGCFFDVLDKFVLGQVLVAD